MESPAIVEELRLLHALTLALDKSENLSSALEIVLKEVCRATGWVLGEAWLPAPDGGTLRVIADVLGDREVRFIVIDQGERLDAGTAVEGVPLAIALRVALLVRDLVGPPDARP